MTKHHAYWPLAALLLIASACGGAAGNAGAGDARAGEIACQRRMVELSGRPAPDRGGVGGGFAGLSEGFARMPLDGCTDNQRLSAQMLVRAAREIASTFARVGDLDALERLPELRTSAYFLALQSQIEGFERRRQALREDLGRMTRDGR